MALEIVNIYRRPSDDEPMVVVKCPICKSYSATRTVELGSEHVCPVCRNVNQVPQTRNTSRRAS
jgi:hypothetical protein